MVLIYCLFFCGYSIDLAQPLLISQVVEAVAKGGDFLPHMLFWCSLLFTSTVFFWAFHWPSRLIERRLAFRLRSRLTETLYSGLTRLPWQWHQVHHSGDTLNRVNLAAQSLYTFADEQFIYIELFMRLIGSMGVLLWIAPSVGAFLIIAIPLIVIILQHFDRILIQLNATQNRAEHYLNAGLVDYLGNIATVLTLRLHETSLGEIRRRLGTIFPTLNRYMKVNEQKWFIFRVLLRFSQVASLSLYVWQHETMATGLLVGALTAILQYFWQIDSATSRFGDYYQIMLRHVVNLDGVSEIEDAIKNLPPANEQKALQWNDASLTGIRFRYEDRTHHIHHLDGVSIALGRGKRIALVGSSGAGKSTLLRLMRGLHDPHAGTLTIDSAPADFAQLAAVSTLVPQDAEIFENTIRYNITCGVEGADEALAASIDMAAFAAVLEDLPQGLDTDIRERGVNLSGGQKQRLALARGLFAARDSTLLLLDEPTSSLDPMTEATIYDRLFATRGDACIVSSVHRLHLLDRFDHIYVMEDGRVIEEGSFNDLLKSQGRLFTLWQAQKKESTGL